MPDPVTVATVAAKGGTSTKFYELSGIMLSLVQAIIYYFLFDYYVDKLEDLADQIGGNPDSWGNQEETAYKTVRGWDGTFYSWYDRYFGDVYQRCEVDVLRAKGGAYQGFGSVMRLMRSTNRGYTPLTMVAHASRNVAVPLVNVSVNRAVAHFHEEQRFDTDLINRWNSTVSMPVFREGQAANFDPIISHLNSQVAAFGKGFNSAGVAFGNALYQYLRK